MSMVTNCFAYFFGFSLVPPKLTPFTFGVPKNFGAMVSVQCILGEGDLPVKILWTFNGNPMESGDGTMISMLGARISNIMIDSVEGRHIGNYTCSAQNKAGTEYYTAQLEVIGTQAIKINFYFSFLFVSSLPLKFHLAYRRSRLVMNRQVLVTLFPYSAQFRVVTLRLM